MPSELDSATLDVLDDLPPFEQQSYEIQTAVYAVMRELGRVEAARLHVRAQWFPQTADDLLGVWEAELGLNVAPPELSLGARRDRVLAFIRSVNGDGSGASWEARLDELLAGGWDYDEHDPADVTSPPAGTLRLLVPNVGPLDAPAAPSPTELSGGGLAAGTWIYRISARNVYGETVAGSAAAITVAALSSVELDWPDVAGASSYAVYRSPDGVTYRRLTTVTTSAFTDDGTLELTNIGLPAANTTASSPAEAARLARETTPANLLLEYGFTDHFLVGISQVGEII